MYLHCCFKHLIIPWYIFRLPLGSARTARAWFSDLETFYVAIVYKTNIAYNIRKINVTKQQKSNVCNI